MPSSEETDVRFTVRLSHDVVKALDAYRERQSKRASSLGHPHKMSRQKVLDAILRLALKISAAA